MGIPLAGTGSVTEDTSVSGSGLLTSTGDVDYLFGSDAGQWTAQTITGLYGSALTIDTNGVWTYTATNANGTLQALNTGDTLTEVFTVVSAAGNTTITITINGLDEPPCFAAGSLIETPEGARPVDLLRAGDRVLTRDSGFQPLRWAGKRHIRLHDPADKAFQPVRLRKNCLGSGVPQRDVLVSPNHRILLNDPVVEIITGQKEVLCAAQFLINGQTIVREPLGEITYHHILFDKHEIVVSSGCESESFFPGEIGLNSLDDSARREVLALLPVICGDGADYGETARPVLKQHEAALLRYFLSPEQKFLARLTAEAA